MKTYNAQEAQEKLNDLPGWEFVEGGIEKSFTFPDFVAAMGFLTQMAIHSEKANHHAEIFNVYNKVKLRLSTHDAGGLTDKDFSLAKTIEGLLP